MTQKNQSPYLNLLKKISESNQVLSEARLVGGYRLLLGLF